MTGVKSANVNRSIPNPYQWGDTENALTIWMGKLVDEKLGYEDLDEYFLKREFTMCEKFDGTNIGRDRKGQIYSRRILIESDRKEFIETSLECVKKTNVNSFHLYLKKELDIYGEGILNTVVIGELMCNPNLHGYITRGLANRWLLFGAILEVDEEIKEIILEKIRDCGFVAKGKENINQIKLVLNAKLAETFSDLGFDCNPNWLHTGTIYDIVNKNRNRLASGEVEGLMVGSLKWKAAHCFQPAVERRYIIFLE